MSSLACARCIALCGLPWLSACVDRAAPDARPADAPDGRHADALDGRPADAPDGCAYGGPGTSLMADCVAEAIGVNTHLNYDGSIYDTRFDDLVKPRLIELGVRHIRDNPHPGATIRDRFVELGRAGVRSLIILTEESQREFVTAVNADPAVKVVDAVEPPNERDVAEPGGEAALRDLVRSLSRSFAADPSLDPLVFAGPSFANTRDSPAALAAVFPDAASAMDVGNLHDYSGVDPEGAYGGGWGLDLDAALDRYRALAGPRPLWVTENGYKLAGAVPGFPATTQRAAAKYLPRQVLSHLMKGVERLYIYQLINNDAEDFGLLELDGAPRAQFTAVKNLIALFADPGPAFRPAALDVTLRGDLTDVYSMTFQKRDGRFYLVLWQGVPSAIVAEIDADIGDLDPPRRSLTVELAAPASVTVYEPSFSTAEVASFPGTRSLPLLVPDHIVVLEIEQRP